MVFIYLFYHMILSKKSATFWDHALAAKPQYADDDDYEYNGELETGPPAHRLL